MYPHLVALRRCRRGRPVVRLVGEPVGEAAERGAVRPGEAPLRHEVLEAEPRHVRADEALERWHVLTQSAPCPPEPHLHHAVLRGGLDLGQGAALRNAAAQRGQPVSRAGEYLIDKYF